MMAVAEHDMEMRLLFPGLAIVPPLDVVDIATHSAEVVPGGSGVCPHVGGLYAPESRS